MSFYTSRQYLDAAAAVYFKGRKTSIEDVTIGDDVLRLLVVDGRIVTKLQFLDVHQPLAKVQAHKTGRIGRYADNVVLRTIGISELESSKFSPSNLAPYVDWSEFRSFEEYQDLLLQRHRGLVRDRERRWRSLSAAHGEPVFAMNDRGDDVLESALRWKSGQLRAAGKKDYCTEPETMAFLHLLQERNILMSSTLRVAGRLISVWIGFIHDGSWSGWIFTYDQAMRKYSAGHQLLNCMLKESHRLGHREFDFSEGAEDYKMIYATRLRILGEIGRKPLGKLVKAALQQRSPEAFRALQASKKAIGGSVSRLAAGLRTA